MTKQEYLDKFNLFYNNASNIAPGLEVSEIEDITNQTLKNLVIGTYSSAFEQTEEVRRYLASLSKKSYCDLTSTPSALTPDPTSYAYTASLPDDLWYITMEALTKSKSNKLLVVPVTQDEVYRILENPFKKPTVHRALRLDMNDNRVEIITTLTPSEVAASEPYQYYVRYVSAPETISLTGTLTGDLSSTMPEALQTKLLEASVEVAKKLWSNS